MEWAIRPGVCGPPRKIDLKVLRPSMSNKCFLVVSAWRMASQRWRFKIVCSQYHHVFGAYVPTQLTIDWISPSLSEIHKHAAATKKNTGNSDNTSDTPVDLRKFQDRWCSLFPWVTYESKENQMFCKLCRDIGTIHHKATHIGHLFDKF
jgi:hypothetical protein